MTEVLDGAAEIAGSGPGVSTCSPDFDAVGIEVERQREVVAGLIEIRSPGMNVATRDECKGVCGIEGHRPIQIDESAIELIGERVGVSASLIPSTAARFESDRLGKSRESPTRVASVEVRIALAAQFFEIRHEYCRPERPPPTRSGLETMAPIRTYQRSRE